MRSLLETACSMATQAASIPGSWKGECRSFRLGSRNALMAAGSASPRVASKVARMGEETPPSARIREMASDSGLTKNHFLARLGTVFSIPPGNPTARVNLCRLRL